MNFSIILPGCNANCDFCSNKGVMSNRGFARADWLKNLTKTLNQALQKGMQECSITGGETTLDLDLLHEVLRLVRPYFQKVVLHSNGYRLKEADLKGRVDHVNISRHSISDEDSFRIFKTPTVPTLDEIEDIISYLEDQGIDTRLNCWRPKTDDDYGFALEYIKMAGKVGASSVAFRFDVSDELYTAPMEYSFIHKPVTHTSSCQVCISRTRKIRGIPVIFKYSMKEPTEHEGGDKYEWVFHTDGKLYYDWQGKKPAVFEPSNRGPHMGEAIARLFSASAASLFPATGLRNSSRSGCGGGGGCGRGFSGTRRGCGSGGC